MSFDIAENIRRHGFKRLLLAVSGGLDSICLAHYFIVNREVLGIEWLGIAHVHHGLREGTADRDAAFVEAFAKAHGIPFFLKKLDGEALKAADGSLEENARDARYKALIEVVSRLSSASEAVSRLAIVTAHHAGDQAETMYMRLRRGTTLAGARGIQEARIMQPVTLEAPCADRVYNALDPIESSTLQDDTSTISIYRPFLNVSREELLAYARENGLEWCEDESNADVKFARNFIRHEALPHLEKTCPDAVEQLCRIAGLADRAYAKVMEKCEGIFAPALCKENPPESGPGQVLQAGDDSDDDKCIGSYRSCGSLQDDTMVRMAAGMTRAISLNKKTLRKVLLAYADADLSELFRLWLSALGFRFPIGFFYTPKEPAHVKIPHRVAYRKRSIVKKGLSIRICEFRTPEEAQKFVSCE